MFGKKLEVIISLIVGVLAFLTSLSGILSIPDRYLMDIIYQKPRAIDSSIKILAIDDKTLERFGPIQSWTREIYANIINRLNNDSNNAPAVIGIDVLFSKNLEKVGDALLAETCKRYNNIVVAESLVFRNTIKTNRKGLKYIDRMSIETRVQPYDDLCAVTEQGFVNALQDAKDGYIRKSLLEVEFEGEVIPSFSKMIAIKSGREIIWPKLDSKSAFGFYYSSKPGGMETISIVDFLDGKIPEQAFKNSITLVGPASAGMMDSYSVPISRGVPMFGVEIHANVIQALLESRYIYDNKSNILVHIGVGLLVGIFLWLSCMLPIWMVGVIGAGLIGTKVVIGLALSNVGQETSLVPFSVFIIISVATVIIFRYISERKSKQQIIRTFEKYVAPQVVKEITKDESFTLKLGGENRNIAVLFVDVRGFTPMSESLQPEEVVDILNEYLSAVTTAIFNNGGTLDKFIGDAAMAIFNAPQDLKDPALKAALTALEIRSHSERLSNKFNEKYGKSVSFGIGLNYGAAVVGNIGSEFRMDYTAIGDTVNTAARLESNAKPGQILISQMILDQIKDKVIVDELGEIPLKGKNKGVRVYILNGIK